MQITHDGWIDNAKHLTMLFAVFFATATYFYQIAFPTCCDANGYLQMAKIYAESGIGNTEFSSLRLYGYPLFWQYI